MSTLDLQILEELGLKRYLSMSYLTYRFANSSRAHLAKRLKKMLDDDWLGRQAALEPLTQRIEYIYFLEKRGVEQLMAASTQFASSDEIDMPKYLTAITHDTALTWLQAFLLRDKEKYLNDRIAELNWESRRSQLAVAFRSTGIFPDAVLKIRMQQTSPPKKYLIEIDNATENLAALRLKFLAYQKYLGQHHDYVLIVVIQHSEKRLAFLVRLAGKVIAPRHGIYACTLPEISTFGIFSNIWTPAHQLGNSRQYDAKLRPRNFADRDRFYLPL